MLEMKPIQMSGGLFTLRSTNLSGDAELLFSYNGNEDVLSIPNLEEVDTNVTISVQIDVENGIISLISFTIENRESEDNSGTESGDDTQEESSQTEEDVVPLKSIIRGNLVLPDGTPVEGAVINPLGYRVTAKSGRRGGFRFEIPYGSSKLRLEITYLDAADIITIRNLPDNAYVLNIELEVTVDAVMNTTDVFTESEASVLSLLIMTTLRISVTAHSATNMRPPNRK